MIYLPAELINKVIDTNKYTKYLELGINKGETFREIKCETKCGVDIVVNEYVTHHMDTDTFFLNNTEKFDIVFVDADHAYPQSEIDILHSLEILNDNGVILCHDTFPKNMFEQYVLHNYQSIHNQYPQYAEDMLNMTFETYMGLYGGYYVGEGWKSIYDIRKKYTNLLVGTLGIEDINCTKILDAKYFSGLTFIKKVDYKVNFNLTLPQLDYFAFRFNSIELLNLITMDEFMLHILNKRT